MAGETGGDDEDRSADTGDGVPDERAFGGTTGGQTDPVSAAADGRDLQDVATWEPRSPLDRLAVEVYTGITFLGRALVVLLALAILLVLLAIGGLGAALEHPLVGLLALLSAIPALGLAAYVWYADSTTSEPLWLLVATFILGILFATFAAVVNSLTQPFFGLIPVVGTVIFFYVVVGPVEETVKWLAVRLYAFRSDSFDAVIDGAVYGAVAGLGFATIENALYISRSLSATDGGATLLAAAGGTAAVRALAGPGHVIYAAFSGYYLGLAKFNPENRGPIVVKGLLIAAFIHATYNTLTGVVPGAIATVVPGVTYAAGVFVFILAYDGVFGYVLYRKLARYRHAYADVVGGEGNVDDDTDADDGTDQHAGATANDDES